MVRDISEREDDDIEEEDQDTPQEYDPTRDVEQRIDEALRGPTGEP